LMVASAATFTADSSLLMSAVICPAVLGHWS
jgi:hypothetical protein